MSSSYSPSICQIEGCECYKQEIPLHLLYWLSHQGIDLQPLFQKPYYHHRKKQYKQTNSGLMNPSNQTSTIEQRTVPREMKHLHNTQHISTQANPNVNVMDDFLSWNVSTSESTDDCDVRRDAPYKIPKSKKTFEAVQTTTAEQCSKSKEINTQQNVSLPSTQTNSTVNVIDEFLSWNVPNLESTNEFGVRRNAPLKVPTNRKNV